ncbi:hypothetical protein [Hominisplanchenecus murintestinalis]|nr:hypothetical protein [Hominisplanchenecus murintestinalis]
MTTEQKRRAAARKKLRVCVNRASGKFLQELDILEDGCGGFEEERFKED